MTQESMKNAARTGLILAQEFYKGNEVELSAVEFESLKSFVEKTESLAIMAKVQILELLKQIL